VCRITDIPPDTTVRIHISFVQNLHLEGEKSLGFVIPTSLAPKRFLEEDNTELVPFTATVKYVVIYLSYQSYLYSLS
jgi:hypothetical protein